MNELAAYSTLAMTLGLVVTRPRLGTTLRISPTAAAVAGCALLFALGIVQLEHVGYALTNLWSPFVAIGSIMVMTESARRVGVLEYWATRLERGAVTTPGLFLRVFVLGVVASSTLNNDAAILVLTPVVILLVHRRFPGRPALKVPFAFAVFMSSGVAALPVSNPMNMVVAELSGITFNVYAWHMLPVAAAGWLVAWVALRTLFARHLQAPLSPAKERELPASPAQVKVMTLLLCILIAYPVVGALGGPMWAVALTGAALSATLVPAPTKAARLELLRCGVSWETLVFLLAVLVMSLGLREVGLVDRLASLYAGASLGTVGVASALGSAVLNNHPMSHLNLLALAQAAPGDDLAVFAALIGGDLGPRLLPMGSLAGLLWLEQLRVQGVEISVGQFFRVGLLLSVPTLALSLGLLSLL